MSELGLVDSREGLHLSSASPSTNLSQVLWGNLLRPLALLFPCLNFLARQTGRPEVPMVATASRSPPRSDGRRRHCAPRLASYRAQPGPGHGSYQRPPRRGGGASGISREQPRFHRPGHRGQCQKAPESVESFVNGNEIRPNDGASFLAPCGVNVNSGACRDVHHRNP